LQALPRGQYDAAKSLEWAMENAYIRNLTSSFKISYTRYSKYFFGISKGYAFDIRRWVDGNCWNVRFG
jgi:hypothetical protein